MEVNSGLTTRSILLIRRRRSYYVFILCAILIMSSGFYSFSLAIIVVDNHMRINRYELCFQHIRLHGESIDLIKLKTTKIKISG